VVSLAEVLRQYWPQYERQFGSAILPSHRRAVQAILNCRTCALGGQVFRCVDCRKDHFVYHSCNHRACPQCGQSDALQWVEQQKLKLLPVPYNLITFTVPEGLRNWLRSHQKQGYAALLRQSASTLQDAAKRPKYLGAELGILSVLHTWGRQLQFHPHVHCVVPAGGLRSDGLRLVPATLARVLPATKAFGRSLSQSSESCSPATARLQHDSKFCLAPSMGR
jgi:hypothetical protein